MYEYFAKKETNETGAENVENYYDQGFVFTRLKKGLMHQIHSCRVVLEAFELSSENRRIERHFKGLSISLESLPYKSYHWSIAKMGLEFYRNKFGEGIISANKIREMFIDERRSNMNAVLAYKSPEKKSELGYCLAFNTERMIHYSYPFYDLALGKNFGMAMMLKAVIFAKQSGKRYIYLGTVKRYKLQFQGVEYYTGKRWSRDFESLYE